LSNSVGAAKAGVLSAHQATMVADEEIALL
jgi:hypothetical protein